MSVGIVAYESQSIAGKKPAWYTDEVHLLLVS
jgi:hypothetical protein